MNRKNGHMFSLLSGILAVISLAGQSPALTLKVKTIKVAGAQSTAVYGINNAGAMVGSYVDSGGIRHGFLLKGGVVTNIDDPNGTDTYCFAISKSGAIVGWYATTLSHSAQGFLYQDGVFTDIGPAGSTGSQAIGINDLGQITGNYGDDNGRSHAFLYDGSHYTQIDVPGATYTLGGSINNHGVMTIVWLDSEFNAESSLYDGNTFTTIDVPGAESSSAGGIDNHGHVVFSWESATDDYRGALLKGGTYHNFRVGARTWGYGINDNHVIVGAFNNKQGVLVGFKATY